MNNEFSDLFDFYDKLSEKDKRILMEHSINRKLHTGQLMIGDNSRCAGIPFVLSGRIRLFRTSENGKDMTIYKVSAGELCVLAAVCSFAHLEYDFTAEAVEESIISVMSIESFNSMLNSSDVFRKFVFSSLADKLIVALNAIELLNFTSIESRLKSYISMQADENFQIINTHENIAKEIGSSREVVSRKLKELEHQGYIYMQRGKITINKL